MYKQHLLLYGEKRHMQNKENKKRIEQWILNHKTKTLCKLLNSKDGIKILRELSKWTNELEEKFVKFGVDNESGDIFIECKTNDSIDVTSINRKIFIERDMIRRGTRFSWYSYLYDKKIISGILRRNIKIIDLQYLSFLIPKKQREAIIGDLLQDRKEMKEAGQAAWWILLITMGQIFTIVIASLKIRFSDLVDPDKEKTDK